MLAELRCGCSTAALTTPLHIASILPWAAAVVKKCFAQWITTCTICPFRVQ